MCVPAIVWMWQLEDNLQAFSLFTIWALGTDHRLSGLLAGAFTYWAIQPPPPEDFSIRFQLTQFSFLM